MLSATDNRADLAGVVAVWASRACAAMVLKLSSSIDDVVWLAPFLTSNVGKVAKMQHSIIYTCVCLTQTVIAMALALCGNSLVEFFTKGAKDAWSSDKILTVGSGALLALYSVKLGCDHVAECRKGEPEEEEPAAAALEASSQEVRTLRRLSTAGRQGQRMLRRSSSSGSTSSSLEAPLGEGGQERGRQPSSFSESSVGSASAVSTSRWQLLIIAFLGSLDDLTLFVPMLAGHTFDLLQLLVGCCAATTVIVCLCLCLGRCKLIADCLASIPLSVIVLAFATMLLVKGLTSH